MPFDFPASPNVGDRTNNSGIWYQWSGVKWTAVGTPNNYAPLGAINNDGRNLVHNPVYTVQQRGTGPWTTGAVYTADRWYSDVVTDTPSFSIRGADDGMRSQIGDEACLWYLDNIFTGSGAAGAYTSICQQIEDVHRLGGKTVTVSFYAWAGPTDLQLGVGFYQQFGASTPAVTVPGQTVTVSNSSWARYSLTFQLPSTAGMPTDEGSYLDKTSLYFWYSSSSTYAVDSGGMPVQSGRITLWGVQLELGTVATPLEKRDPAVELQLCSHFYTTGGGALNAWGNVNGNVYITTALSQMMRAPPTIVLSTSGEGNASSIVAAGIYPNSFIQVGTAIDTSADAVAWNFSYTASADL